MNALGPTPLLEWMKERQAIFRRRESGAPRPWTADPLMQKYRFCNVFRELDKVTAWLKVTWRDPFADHPRLPFAMALARMVNHPDTLAELGFPKRWDRARYVRIMEARQARGDKLFTSAYQVWPGTIVPGTQPRDLTKKRPRGFLGRTEGAIERIARTLDELDARGPADRWVRYDSLEGTFNALLEPRIYGLARFTAYEMVTDLRHTPWLSKARDVMTWCNIGQGSRCGLNRIHGRPVKRSIEESRAVGEVQDLLAVARDELKTFDPMFKKLEMRDVEHSLCELDKYVRARDEGGQPRERFHPQGDRT